MMTSFVSRIFNRIRPQKLTRGRIVKSVLPLEPPTYAAQAEKLIIDRFNAIYIVIPKTGCTSIKKFFSNYFAWNEVGSVHNPESEIYQHVFNGDLGQEKFRGHFIFTFVRNPFSRIYSAYKSKVRPDYLNINHPKWVEGVEIGIYEMGVRIDFSFSDFVDLICATPDNLSDPHVKSQWQFMVSNNGALLVDKWYKFEHFQPEFLRLLTNLGIDIETEQIPHENRMQSNQDEYVTYYNKRLVNNVIERYENDFSIFGYSNELQG